MDRAHEELIEEAAKGQRVRTFFEIEAATLERRFRVMETLLPNSRTRGAAHRGEEGRYIEALLRTFLNKHLPKNLQAVSGFVLCPATKTGRSDTERVRENQDRHSSQIDIIIYDFDSYPVYERFEEFCIVPPEGVIGLISVKKTLDTRDVANEIVALRSAARLCATRGRRGPFTALFGFSANEKRDQILNKKIFDSISDSYADLGDFDTMVNEVSVLSRTCVFKVRNSDSPPNKAKYIGVDCVNEVHIPLQRLIQSLLSVYYDSTRGSSRERPGFVSFKRSTFRSSPILGYVGYQVLRPNETPADSLPESQ